MPSVQPEASSKSNGDSNPVSPIEQLDLLPVVSHIPISQIDKKFRGPPSLRALDQGVEWLTYEEHSGRVTSRGHRLN